MINFMRRVPAGTFLIPMVVSMVIYSFWPSLFKIGGPTEAFFSSAGTNYIIGLLVFASGTTVDLNKIGKLLKHQGALVVFKIVLSIIYSFVFLYFFGLEGIWGISGLGFVAVIMSINPAINLSITDTYGEKDDAAIYPFAVIPSLPAIPLIIMSVYISGGLGEVDWTPVISVFFPLIVGIIFGNVDKEMGKIFGAAMPASLILLGWLLGQNMNMFEAIKSGVSGVIVTVIFMALTMPLMDFFETKILHYEGYSGIALSTVAGVTTAVPAIVAVALPQVSEYVVSATAQILTATIITNVFAPIIVRKLYGKRHH